MTTRRLRIFARGNVDVHDALVASRIGEQVAWNGINELLRPRGIVARVTHETAGRSDVLARLPMPVPPELAAREASLELGAFPLATQFATALYDGGWDAIVLSIVQDAMTGLVRHRGDGWMFFPGKVERWSADARQWAQAVLEPVPLLAPEAAAEALTRVVARVRERSQAPILVLNASPYVPGERVHCYAGVPDSVALRLARMNLALAEVSRDTGISIVDVDRVLAGAGAARLKIDALHCTGEGHRLVCEEVVRVLGDVGLFDSKEE